MTSLTRRAIAAVLGVAICVLPAVTPSARAADPTPVPAPLVDLDDDTASPSASPSASPPSSLPSSPSDNFTPSPDSDVLGGSQLAKRGAVADLSAGAAQLPQVKARTWLLADATTGEVLAAKNAHKARRPASTLKTLTALTLLPQLEPDATWIGTAQAQNTYGSKAGIRKGREYTIDELFAGLLLPSGNDAAIALAQAHSTVSATVAEMNQVARDLQAYNTTATNPSGLDAKGQFSTAYDLALIGRAAIARDDFLAYAGAKRAEFPNPGNLKKNGKERKPITIYNQNDLVMENYRGVIGVKTGYTSQAGRAFIGAAKRGNTTLIVSLMGIREPSDDAARKLLNWGFQNRGRIVSVGELVLPLSAVEATVAEEAVVPVAPTPVVTAVRGSAPQESVAEPELSSLSPTSWGWLAVFTIALVLALVTLIRRIMARRQRRILT